MHLSHRWKVSPIPRALIVPAFLCGGRPLPVVGLADASPTTVGLVSGKAAGAAAGIPAFPLALSPAPAAAAPLSSVRVAVSAVRPAVAVAVSVAVAVAAAVVSAAAVSIERRVRPATTRAAGSRVLRNVVDVVDEPTRVVRADLCFIGCGGWGARGGGGRGNMNHVRRAHDACLLIYEVGFGGQVTQF